MMTRIAIKTGLRIVGGVGTSLPIWVLGFGFLGACAAPAPAPEAPPAIRLPQGLQQQSGLHLGSILSGPMDGVRKPADPVMCQIDVALLRDPKTELLKPLGSDLRLVAELQGKNPVQGGSRLAVGARWSHGSEAEAAWASIQAGEWGDHLDVDPFKALVPKGTTYTVRLTARETIPDPDNFLREWPDRGAVTKSVAVALFHDDSADGDELVAGFSLGDLVEAEGDEELGRVPVEGGRPGGDFLREEWILPNQAPSASGDPVLWLLPSPFELNPARTLAILVRVQAVDTEDSELWDAQVPELTTWLEEDLGEAEQELETEQQAKHRRLVRALGNVVAARRTYAEGDPSAAGSLRGALVYLCSLVELPLGHDLCLTGDATTLVGWVDLVPEAADQHWASSDALAWDVERAAWVWLARSMVKADLPNSLASLVLRHGGEAGHYPSILEDSARNSIDLATFEKRLQQENRLFLEDASPAARVRAFDWLQRRGQAPPDWDPLETKKKRRAVLGPWLTTFESTETTKNGEGS